MTTAPQSTRRLSALDGSFLRLDTPQSPMHVGWSAVFAAPDGDRPRPTIEALRERAAGRCTRCRGVAGGWTTRRSG